MESLCRKCNWQDQSNQRGGLRAAVLILTVRKLCEQIQLIDEIISVEINKSKGVAEQKSEIGRLVGDERLELPTSSV